MDACYDKLEVCANGRGNGAGGSGDWRSFVQVLVPHPIDLLSAWLRRRLRDRSALLGSRLALE